MVSNILHEADAITSGDRQASYGRPEDNHGLTAALWTAFLQARACGDPQRAIEIDDRDVCILNILQKISREAFSPKRDNLVDIAGYARNAEMIEQRDEVQPP